MGISLPYLRVYYEIGKLLSNFRGAELSMPDILQELNKILPMRSALLIERRDGSGGPQKLCIWHAPRSDPEHLASLEARARKMYLVLGEDQAKAASREKAPEAAVSELICFTDGGEPTISNARFLTLPLVVAGGSIFGTLQLECTQDVTEEALPFAVSISNHLAIAFTHHYRIEAHEELCKRERSSRLQAEKASRELGISEEFSRQSKEAAEFANRSKTSFLANMSHEIRTPLAAILGFGELLKDPELSLAKRREFVETITRNGYELTLLIDDILDLSKVEAGRLAMKREAFSLPALLGNVERLLSLKAKQKHLVVTFDIAPHVPDSIVSDASRLRQILINVIDNAIKFTEGGTISISVGMSTGQDGVAKLLAITVRDTGPGMSKEEKGRIFQPFMQGKDATATKYGGTGLGLVLSQRLAQNLGGNLALTASDPGAGSTFVITVDPGPCQGKLCQIGPLAVTDRTGSAAALSSSQVLAGLRILVADDVIDNQVLLNYLLRKAGASVDLAGDGAEVIAMAEAHMYDVVLVDMQMPVLNGFEATRELRRRGFQKPIIALTAFAMEEDREECLLAGCDEHLAKPLNHSALILAIERHAASGRQPRAVTTTLPPPPKQQPSTPSCAVE